MFLTVFFALILTVLILLPCIFLAAGKDTDSPRYAQIEIRQEALLDWTDKSVLTAEHARYTPSARPLRTASPCPVTIISRDSSLSPLKA